MDLTTLARVKAQLGLLTSTAEDAGLALLITEVSAAVAEALRRHTEAVERTEQFSLRGHQRLVPLRGFPVATDPAPEVRHDSTRAFANDAIDSSLYWIDVEAGLLHLETELGEGPGVLQVIYTGGMAADADAFVVAFPDIAGWVDKQVAHEHHRRKTPGGTARGNSGTGSTTYEGELDLLDGLVRTIKAHRSVGWFA